MTTICGQCHKPREVKRKPKAGSVCRPCKHLNDIGKPTKPNRIQAYRICKTCDDKLKIAGTTDKIDIECMDCYKKQAEDRVRVCVDCGDVKQVESLRDMKSLRCFPCNRIFLGKERKGKQTTAPRIRYYYFCSKCPTISIAKAKRNSTMCQDCARRNPRKLNPKIFLDLNTMETIRIESEVILLRQLKKMKPKRIRVAREKKVRVAKTIKPKKIKRVKARKKPTQNEIMNSSQFIDKQREANKQHKEDLVKQKEIVMIPQRLSDEDMIAKFLKRNKPSVVDTITKIPHLIGISAYASNSSCLSS